ncbi:MAG: PepSY domain-containing protein [Clostridiales bacterium]|nr:PepSY domain-containing protein [Clostridiales bacterium]
MNTHDMEQKLRTAVDHLTPDDGLPEILAACAETTRGEQPIMEYTTSPKRDNRFIKGMSLASAACIMVAGLFWWNRYRALNYVVEMDVNPSIELRVNNAEKVIKAYPLNEDGKEILDDMKLTGIDVDIAANAIIGSMLKNGYLSEAESSILLSVESDDYEKSSQVQQRLSGEIGAALESIGGSVIGQTVTANSAIRTTAGDYNISEGKAALILSIHNELPMLKMEDLAAMSINDLNLLANSRQIQISNASVSGTAGSGNYIGEEAAKEKALTHAGISAGDVQQITAKLDYDDGRMEYEVEFFSGGIEYEYEIDARTGQVLRYEYDALPAGNTGADTRYLSGDQAKELALKDAGVQDGDALFVKVKLDRENDRMVYEVEFYAGNMEYDYELDAVTGEVISVDHEIEHFTRPADGEYIGAEKAKELALDHAGVDAGDAVFLKAELDLEDGTVRYEVEFVAGNTEYDYEIDAITGKVLSWDFDTDHPLPSPSTAAVTEAAAREKALDHAGISASAATFTKTKLDYEDGRSLYEVEFFTDSADYEYEIDASTGEVLSADSEARHTTAGDANHITEGEAQEIALKKAGLTASETDYIRVDLDYDDGRAEYEVEIRVGQTEYELKIDASTGTVLEYEVDR